MSIIVGDNTTTKNYWAVFGLLFGAASWGVIWYPYRIMQEAGVSGVASSFYTYTIAASLGVLLFARHWRGLGSLPQTAFWLAIVAGWTNLSYVLAVIDGEVMRVMLLFYLSPLWTLLLAHFWLREHIGRKGLLVMGISLTGAFIMLWQPNAMPIPHNTAEWLALSAGIGFALTNVITRRASHMSLRVKSMAVWFGVIGMSLLVQPVLDQPFPSPQVFTALNWLIMTLIALLLMAATLFVQYGVTRIPASKAAVIFLFELVVAAIASYYLAGETMQVQEWIGGALIVLASFWAAVSERDSH
ncbi:DMT family transporter [Methylobacillus flagellatus]|uniref:DMT family transporter n=1 Tax=Methylobacillus flagellatus TaxID=405 RepID=UPI002571296E|nr:DMT family transporter [Methylobacillus flagellatus]